MAMSSVSSIAASGMLTAAARLETSASKIANSSSGADLAAEAVNQVEARLDFAANAVVLRAGHQMIGALLDVLA
jgi:flagellar basal body rod protein FlgC